MKSRITIALLFVALALGCGGTPTSSTRTRRCLCDPCTCERGKCGCKVGVKCDCEGCH